MLGLEMTINVALEFGQPDLAMIEGVIHEALQQAGVPVVSVEFDGISSQSPLGTTDVFDPAARRVGALGPPGPFGRTI